MYEFIVNGQPVQAQEDKNLLHFLREDLRLTSVKNGCAEGACGSCTVLLEGKARKACLFSTSQLVGKSLLTVEGLSPYEKEVYTYAFAHCGAVQCGFCTPGMVLAAKALLDVTPQPTRAQAAKAIQGNICRCTGYQKILDAILQAGQLLHAYQPVPALDFTGGVGQPVPRIDAAEKVLGTGVYVDDMQVEGMLHAGVVRSAHPRAVVNRIDYAQAQALPGVVAVLTAEDIPGQKKIGHLKQDWDVLIAEGETTRYVGDALVLIAAESPQLVQQAKALVTVDYTVLPPITSPEQALAPGAPPLHEGGNCLAHEQLKRGNAAEKIKQSKYTVTHTYTTPFTEHAFLEPEAALALPEGDGLRIYTSDQGTYTTRRECANMLGLPKENITVFNCLVGGGFGGKEDMSVQHHAALLAYHTRRPVKLCLSREESMRVHPKRHPMQITCTTACDENGYLTAMQTRIVSDTGAYASLGGPVLQRACTHAGGPYNYHAIDIEGFAAYTNNPPAGPFRGFGVPQSCFATECNLNRLAELTGLSYWEIRRRNAVLPGQTLPNGQIADASTAFVETLEAVKDVFESSPHAGIACGMKNSGLGVGVLDVGRCRLLVRGGKVQILAGASCVGQGLGTVLVQTVCQASGLLPEQIEYLPSNTATAPDAGNTSASRQTLITGEATRRAATLLHQALQGKSLALLEGQEFLGEFEVVTDAMGSDKPNPVSHITYGYATHVVLLDDEGRLAKVVAAHDVGKAMNPLALEGQIEGGVVMSLGYALTENFPLQDGHPTARYGTLGLFRALQTPPVESIFIEKGDPSQPAWGAKGVGEICCVPTAPAVQLAYYRRDGIFRTALPLENTPYTKLLIKNI